MSRSVRLFELATLLAGRRSRSLGEIVEQFDVSERTAYRDLSDLSRMAPVVRDDGGYRLLEGATLRPLNLSPGEYALLKVALQHPSLRRQPALAATLDRLERKLDAVIKTSEERADALQLAGVVRFGPVPPGVEEALESAVVDGHRVEILYTSLSGRSERWREVGPWRMFERDGAWYLVAWCYENEEPRIFRLDRMGEVRHLHAPSPRPDDFDLERFLARSWSVYLGREPFDIALRFDTTLAPLLLNGRNHMEERVEQLEDGTVSYRVRLNHLEEIARWCLGFGGKVTIVSPDELRERVAELARKALAAATTESTPQVEDS